MARGRVFNAHVNPLQFIEADEPWATAMGREPTLESALRFACGLNATGELPAILTRYREISTEPIRLSFAPVDQRLDDKLTGPLRAAKAAYMLGSPLACIALAGMVGEMLAMLLWELATVTIGGQPMTPEREVQLLGSHFERLGQERRVAVLAAYGLIGDPVRDSFTLIRTIRRRYLHLWSQDHEGLNRDAVQAYQAAVHIAVEIIGQNVDQGMIRLTDAMLRYLDRNGRIQDLPEQASEAG